MAWPDLVGSLVIVDGADSDNATSYTFTLSQTATAGNLLVSAVNWDKDAMNTGDPTCEGDSGNEVWNVTYIEDTGTPSTASSAMAWRISDGSETDCVWSWDNSEQLIGAVGEYEGPWAASPVDKEVEYEESTNVNNIPFGSLGTLAQADEMIYAIGGWDTIASGTTFTWSDDGTVSALTNLRNFRATGTGNGQNGASIGRLVVSATTAPQPKVTTDPSSDTDAVAGVLKTFKKGSSGVSRSPPQTDLALTTDAPVPLINFIRSAPQADLAISTNAPAIAGATWKGDLNTAISGVELDTICHIVFQLDHNGAAEANYTAQLESNTNGAGWQDVTATSTNIRSAATTRIVDGVDVPQLLGSGTYLSTNAGFDEVDGASGGANLDFPEDGTVTEVNVQFCFTARSADLTGSETIQLRIKGCEDFENTAQLTLAANIVVSPPQADLVIDGKTPSTLTSLSRLVPQTDLAVDTKTPILFLEIFRVPGQADLIITTSTPEVVIPAVQEAGPIDVAFFEHMRRQLRKYQREAERKRKRELAEHREARLAARQELEEIYDFVVHGITPQIAEQAADIIRPVAESEALVPAAESVDFDALTRRADLLSRLATLVGDLAKAEMDADEEEDLLLMTVL